MDGGGGKKFLVLNRGGSCLSGCPGLERIIVRMVIEVCEGIRSLPPSLYRNTRVASVASGFQKSLSVEWPPAVNNGSVESSGRWLKLLSDSFCGLLMIQDTR